VKDQVEQELEKFNMMDPSSSEYIVTRNWLDLICSLPWVSPLSNDFDMAQAQKTLEADHLWAQRRQGQNRRVSRGQEAQERLEGLDTLPCWASGVGKTSVGRSHRQGDGQDLLPF